MAVSCSEDEKDKGNKTHDVMVLQPTSRELNTVYSATIRGKQDIDIRPKVSGYITSINVKEGASVSQGQTLFIIDQSTYKAQLETAIANVNVAKAAVAAAELTLGSKKKLLEQNIISTYEYQMASTSLAKEKAVLEQARANEVNARNNLNYTVVKSPVSGIVGSLPFRVGTLVSPNDATPLTTVSDNSDMYVYFSMTESQVLDLTREFGNLDKVIQNMPDLDLKLSDGSIYPEKGRIEAISGIIDPTTGAISVRAKFPNRERILLSGGSGDVVMPHYRENCLVIPQSATYEVQDKIFAFRYSSGKAEAKVVNVFPISDGKEYVVEDGVVAGDTIVVSGVGVLKDGKEINLGKMVNGEEEK